MKFTRDYINRYKQSAGGKNKYGDAPGTMYAGGTPNFYGDYTGKDGTKTPQRGVAGVYNQAVEQNVQGHQQNNARTGGDNRVAQDASTSTGEIDAGGQGSGQQGQGSGGQTGSPGSGTGYMNFKGIMDGIYGYEPNEWDDEGRAMKNAFAYDTMGKFFDSMLSRGMGQYQAGLSKDMMNHAFSLEQMGLSNSRKEEFGYGMRAMDKQYELQNLFANQEHGRALGTLTADYEQRRKTTSNEYNEQRKNLIVGGEQDRLLEAAKGDQTRQNYAVKGEQDRLGYMTQGAEDRKSRETQGKQDRMLEVTRGDQTRLTKRVEGQEERLNIGARGDQERQTIDFSDKISARKEGRERGRAHAAARSF